MELSENTLQVLKNYATINPNIIINEGKNIKTVSEMKGVASSATLDCDWPVRFGIYDLNEFLSALSLVDKPRLDFKDTHLVIKDSSGRSGVKYFYANEEILTSLDRDLKMPDIDINFTLDSTTLSKIKRAASVLGHDYLSVTPNNGSISLSVVDSKDSSGSATSNSFSIDVEGNTNSDDFEMVFNISNLKMVEGDYNVGISKNLISQFENKDNGIKYWCALEKESRY